VFEKLYGKEAVTNAVEHISGKQKLSDLTADSLNLTSFPLHQKLLKAYEKLQTAKI
jgi:ribosomal protein S12 methylthiotransferase accessory factor